MGFLRSSKCSKTTVELMFTKQKANACSPWASCFLWIKGQYFDHLVYSKVLNICIGLDLISSAMTNVDMHQASQKLDDLYYYLSEFMLCNGHNQGIVITRPAFTCSKLTIKTPEWRHWHCWPYLGVFIVKIEHILHIVMFRLLTLNKEMSAGIVYKTIDKSVVFTTLPMMIVCRNTSSVIRQKGESQNAHIRVRIRG